MTDTSEPASATEARRYVWPEEWGLFSVPLDNYLYEPSAEDPRIFEPVRMLTAVEMAAKQAARKAEERRLRREARRNSPGRTALYRVRDASEQLLYVGISDAPHRRWSEHALDKPWWSAVASLAIEWHETRDQALVAEEAAITTEQPLHNVRHRVA
ncbi:GIY-YIG nuclease family protein [Streptomyces xanthophaeus]|uniref:GIY-YIG nuclease family protein n=1 Tax=Streptomyces xanthophaeus TaxID=67385 RepID=UPI00371B134A